MTHRGQTFKDVERLVPTINRKLLGWAQYFCLGSVNKAYDAVSLHAARRLRQWLCNKHKVKGTGESRFPKKFLHGELGLIRLRRGQPNLSWAYE